MSDRSFAAATEGWCGIAARILGWKPAEFWSATPRELAASLGGPDANGSAPPPSRELIEQMMEREKNG